VRTNFHLGGPRRAGGRRAGAPLRLWGRDPRAAGALLLLRRLRTAQRQPARWHAALRVKANDGRAAAASDRRHVTGAARRYIARLRRIYAANETIAK